MARLILDTSVLISMERRGRQLEDVASATDEVAMAAISAAELLVGTEMGRPRERTHRRRRVQALLDLVPIEAYDLDVARAHAVLLSSTIGGGRARGAHDLIIAATAMARNRAVVTMDRRGFVGLPGIEVRAPGA